MLNRIIITKNDIEIDPTHIDLKVDQRLGIVSFNLNNVCNKDDKVRITYYTTNGEVKKQKRKALYKHNKFERLNFLPINT